MSILVGPSRLARSACDGCGVLCLDEELESSACSTYAYCADCARAVLEERRAEQYDAEVQYEPRGAF